MKKLFVWVLLIFLVLLRFLTTRPVYKDGDRVRVSGKLMQEPIRYSDTQLIKMSSLIFYLPIHETVYYGDYLTVEGKVEVNKLKDTTLVKREENKSIAYGLRKKIVDNFKSWLPEPHASLVLGITLGSKEGMSEGFKEDLIISGVAHVVVASGTNVIFVAAFLISLFSFFFKRDLATPFTILGIFFYTFLSGFEAPVVRASIMAAITLLAQLLGKLAHTYRLLILTAIIMLLVRPDWLFDYGFILSFAATLSLVLFQKRVDKKINFIPKFFRESISTTLSAQIGVIPILFVTFGRFSIWAIFSNSLILWTIPPIMIITSIAGLLGLLSVNLGKVLSYLSYPLTAWFIYVVGLFS